MSESSLFNHCGVTLLLLGPHKNIFKLFLNEINSSEFYEKKFVVDDLLIQLYNLGGVYLRKSEIAGSNRALAFKSQKNKMFLSCSIVKIEHCGEPL